MASQTLVTIMVAQQEAELLIEALRSHQRGLLLQDRTDGIRAELMTANLLEALVRGNLAAVRMGA